MQTSPAPWSVRHSGTGRTAIVADDNVEVAFVLSHPKYHDGNANLIAAAPALLRALEQVSRSSKAEDSRQIATTAMQILISPKLTGSVPAA
jgi:hypothetical protein